MGYLDFASIRLCQIKSELSQLDVSKETVGTLEKELEEINNKILKPFSVMCTYEVPSTGWYSNYDEGDYQRMNDSYNKCQNLVRSKMEFYEIQEKAKKYDNLVVKLEEIGKLNEQCFGTIYEERKKRIKIRNILSGLGVNTQSMSDLLPLNFMETCILRPTTPTPATASEPSIPPLQIATGQSIMSQPPPPSPSAPSIPFETVSISTMAGQVAKEAKEIQGRKERMYEAIAATKTLREELLTKKIILAPIMEEWESVTDEIDNI